MHVLYETAWSDDAGTVHFRADLYGRDDTLKKQLAAVRTGRSTSVARRAPQSESRVVGPEAAN